MLAVFAMIIPHTELADETLINLIQAFITREGTDYGEQEYALPQKTQQVRDQLDAGNAVILYDTENDDFTIVFKEDIPGGAIE